VQSFDKVKKTIPASRPDKRRTIGKTQSSLTLKKLNCSARICPQILAVRLA